MEDLQSIMGSEVLADNECIVALDDGGTGWILARSKKFRQTDVMPECSAEDNGFNHSWSQGLVVGVYRLTIKPWSARCYEGDWDCGIDVTGIKPLWVVS